MEIAFHSFHCTQKRKIRFDSVSNHFKLKIKKKRKTKNNTWGLFGGLKFKSASKISPKTNLSVVFSFRLWVKFSRVKERKTHVCRCCVLKKNNILAKENNFFGNFYIQKFPRFVFVVSAKNLNLNSNWVVVVVWKSVVGLQLSVKFVLVSDGNKASIPSAICLSFHRPSMDE